MTFWKQKVMQASENAIEFAAVNAELPPTSLAATVTAQCPADREIYTEARSLIRNWMINKAHTQHDWSDDNDNDQHQSNTKSLWSLGGVKKEWDHLADHDDDARNAYDNFCDKSGEFREFSSARKSYLEKYNLPDFAAAAEKEKERQHEHAQVMRQLTSKQFVSKKALNHVDNPPKIDLKQRMEQRQQQVKERRETQRQLEAEQRRKRLELKEADAAARKQQEEEARSRRQDDALEEQRVQREIARLRREIEHEKRATQEQREREERAARLEADRAKQAELETRLHREQLVAQEHQKQRDLETKVAQIREQIAREERHRMQLIIRPCFEAWKTLMWRQKAAGMRAEAWWRLRHMQRCMTAWRRITVETVMQRELTARQEAVMRDERNWSAAVSWARRRVLRRCWSRWTNFVRLQKMGAEFTPPLHPLTDDEVLQNLTQQKKTEQDAAESTAREEEERQHHQKIAESSKRRADQLVMKLYQQQQQNLQKQEGEKQQKQNKEDNEAELVASHCSPTVETRNTNKPERKSTQKDKLMLQDEMQRETTVRSARPISVGTHLHQEPREPTEKEPTAFSHRFKQQQKTVVEQRTRIKDQQQMIEQLQLDKQQLELEKRCATANTNITGKKRSANAVPTSPHQSEHRDQSEEDINQNHTKKTSAISEFNQKMEERSEMRRKMKEEREEKRRQQQAEKQAEIDRMIEEQKNLDLLEKKKRQRELKEKRRQEAEEKQKQEEQQRREDELMCIAIKHHSKYVIRQFGIKPFLKLMLLKYDQLEKARAHHTHELIRKSFLIWKQQMLKNKVQEDQLVSQFYTRNLLKRCFFRFKMYKDRLLILEIRASKWCDERLKSKYFCEWRLNNHRRIIELEQLELQAIQHHEKTLLRNTIRSWITFKRTCEKEREKERRRDKLRAKITEIIPDFNGAPSKNSLKIRDTINLIEDYDKF